MERSVAELPQPPAAAALQRKISAAAVTGYALTFSAFSIVTGLIWDISWHMTIGRDSFWTAAHMVIYLGGLVGGLSCGWLILRTTFAGTARERDGAVRIWGFRGPLGAWTTVWGAAAMLTSAPFDNWWHAAYGLDVRILSPPHTVLGLGMLGIIFGSMLMSASNHNRGENERISFGSLYLFGGGILLAAFATLFSEQTLPNKQHGMGFYAIAALLYPLLLTAIASGSGMKWPATVAAASYMAIEAGMAWLLELFPAHPLLGPIYRPVDHMVPPAFPLLLVIPALAIDLLRRRFPGRGSWTVAALLGIAFMAVFFAVQWPFSMFLISEAASNALFLGGRIWSYADTPGHWEHEFWTSAQSPVRLRGMAIALATAIAGARAGMGIGGWMRKVRR